jgi:hypothetical protein
MIEAQFCQTRLWDPQIDTLTRRRQQAIVERVPDSGPVIPRSGRRTQTYVSYERPRLLPNQVPHADRAVSTSRRD